MTENDLEEFLEKQQTADALLLQEVFTPDVAQNFIDRIAEQLKGNNYSVEQTSFDSQAGDIGILAKKNDTEVDIDFHLSESGMLVLEVESDDNEQNQKIRYGDHSRESIVSMIINMVEGVV
jgi:hypothetical protein